MATYEVTLTDRTVQLVGGVDAYQQEGPMTTFFRTGEGRHMIDSWSTRVASVRTAEVLLVRLCPRAAVPASVALARASLAAPRSAHPAGRLASAPGSAAPQRC